MAVRARFLAAWNWNVEVQVDGFYYSVPLSRPAALPTAVTSMRIPTTTRTSGPYTHAGYIRTRICVYQTATLNKHCRLPAALAAVE